MNEGDKAECGCIVKPHNVPETHDKVNTIQLVCSHGISESQTPFQLDVTESETEEFHVAQMVAWAVASWMAEDFQGEHLKGWLINWGTESEWSIRMTDSGPAIVWNRCNDAERLVDETTVAWSFHSGMYLHEWAFEMITREGGPDITVIDLN